MFFTALAVFFTIFSTVFAQSTVTLDLSSLDNPQLHRSDTWGAFAARTNATNASVWFTFTGTGIDIWLHTYFTYGYVQIDVDGQVVKYDTYSNAGHVWKACAYCVTGLESRLRNVTLTNLGPSQNTTKPLSWLYMSLISYTADDSTESSASAISPSSSTASGHTPNRGGIIGGVFTGLVVLSLIVIAVVLLLGRQRQRREQKARQSQWSTASSPFHVSPAVSDAPMWKEALRPVAIQIPPPMPMPDKLRRLKGLAPLPTEDDSLGTPEPQGSHVTSNSATSDEVREELVRLREMVTQLAHPPTYSTHDETQ